LICKDESFLGVKSKLMDALECAKSWYKCNSLAINEEKTEIIYFSLKRESNFINETETVKLLGIHIDSKLSWEQHVNELCKRLARITYLLRKLKSCVGLHVLLTTYYGVFNSQLLYGLRLWGGSHHAQRVFIWQKKAIRAMMGMKNHESCRGIFSSLNILTLPSMYILCNLIHVKNNSILFPSHSHLYNTRHKDNLVTPQVRLSKSINSHLYLQYVFFNKLPVSIRELPLRQFKKKIEKFLSLKEFYTMEEFVNSEISLLDFT